MAVAQKSPDELMGALEAANAALGHDSPVLMELMWEIFEDILSSFDLALEGHVDPQVAKEIRLTIEDYLMNYYGIE